MAIQTLFGSIPTEPTLLDRLKAGVEKTRSGLVDRLEDVLSGKKTIDAELLEELEYTLITADLGVRTVQDIDGIQRLPIAFERLEVPIIAAVNGPAIGAGCDVACMCDIRIAGRSASFAESFVKVGLIPGDGGAWLLPRAIGQSRAREMAFTGDAMSADDALACGLVSQVVDDDKLIDAARAVAARIAANPPHAVRMTKRLMTVAQDLSLENVLDVSAAMQPLAHATKDHREALDAFVGKRKPDFTGR